MKIFYTLLFSLLFISAHGQEILDNSRLELLFDYLVEGGDSIKIGQSDDCWLGYVQINTEEPVYLGYTSSAKFDFNANTWVAIANCQPSEDYGPNFATIIHRKDGNLVIQPQEDFSEAISVLDFTMYNDSLLVCLDNSLSSLPRLVVLNFEAEIVDTYQPQTTFKLIDQYAGQTFAFGDYGIFLLDTNFKIVSTYVGSKYIELYRWFNDYLYIFHKDEITILDRDLNYVNTIILENTKEVLDAKVTNGTIHILQEDAGYSYISRIDSLMLNEIIVAVKSDNKTFKSFAKGDQNEIIYGTQVIQIDAWKVSENTIVSTYMNLGNETADYAIEMLDITSRKDSFIIHIAENDTFYRNVYDYYLTFSIFNQSDEVLDDCLVLSPGGNVFNCYKLYFVGKYENLNLLPGESRILSDSVSISHVFSEFCLALVSTNQRYEDRLDNNISCKEVISLATYQPQVVSSLIVYPNPAQDVLYIESIYSGPTYSIFTSTGEAVSKGRYSSSGIDVSGLPQGLYLLLTSNLDGVRCAKFSIVH